MAVFRPELREAKDRAVRSFRENLNRSSRGLVRAAALLTLPAFTHAGLGVSLGNC